MQGRSKLWFSGEWTTFLGRDAAAESGIRAACAAGHLQHRQLPPAARSRRRPGGACVSAHGSTEGSVVELCTDADLCVRWLRS
eukprot:SAG31_NODE_4423_length_3247_cov_2.442503_5_plen_83_part_00